METTEFERLRKLLTPVFVRTGAVKAVLFGSFAAGRETRRSDLDLMIVKDTDKRFFDRFEEFSEIYELVKDRGVDLLIYTPGELESISHRSFIKQILAEGRTLYEH